MILGIGVAAAILAAVLIAVILWAVKGGQFKNVKGIKYEILEDKDDATTRHER